MEGAKEKDSNGWPSVTSASFPSLQDAGLPLLPLSSKHRHAACPPISSKHTLACPRLPWAPPATPRAQSLSRRTPKQGKFPIPATGASTQSQTRTRAVRSAGHATDRQVVHGTALHGHGTAPHDLPLQLAVGRRRRRAALSDGRQGAAAADGGHLATVEHRRLRQRAQQLDRQQPRRPSHVRPSCLRRPPETLNPKT
jgi:hypothetical protein